MAQVFAALVVGGWITEDQSKSLLLVIAGLVGSAIIYGYTYFKNRAAAKLANTQIKVALKASPETPVAVVKTEAAAIVANS